MAHKKQYALLDTVANVYLNPLTFITDAEAIRWFTVTVNDNKQDTMINKHPEGYSLYRLADYDDKTGMYHPRDVQGNGDPSQEPKLIITGIQVVEKEPKYSIEQIRDLIKDTVFQAHADLPPDITNINRQK